MRFFYNVAIHGSYPDSVVYLDGVKQNLVTAFRAGKSGWLESLAQDEAGKPFVVDGAVVRNTRVYGHVTVENHPDFAWTLEQ